MQSPFLEWDVEQRGWLRDAYVGGQCQVHRSAADGCAIDSDDGGQQTAIADRHEAVVEPQQSGCDPRRSIPAPRALSSHLPDATATTLVGTALHHCRRIPLLVFRLAAVVTRQQVSTTTFSTSCCTVPIPAPASNSTLIMLLTRSSRC
uniref:Uncharacterized protein n=1 Tax=Mycobacterium leprae TaxID=1769 RepID=O07141_MYCLR|nr:hypothetical protein MLCL581.08 [Mycobacterium leprae]